MCFMTKKLPTLIMGTLDNTTIYWLSIPPTFFDIYARLITYFGNFVFGFFVTLVA